MLLPYVKGVYGVFCSTLYTSKLNNLNPYYQTYQMFAQILAQETADINLSLLAVNGVLEFVCGKLTLFADQVVGTINFVQVLLGVEKSNAVESLDLLVGAQMDVLAD